VRSVLGPAEAWSGEDETSLWTDAANLTWNPKAGFLVKIPLTESLIEPLEEHLSETTAQRRYCGAGNLLFLAWPNRLDKLQGILGPLGLSGLVLNGPAESPFLGSIDGVGLRRRIKQALDPGGRFPNYDS
jgi:hypothetical protein